MLKFTYPIGLSLAAAVALPAALSKQSLQGTPEEALTSTLAAIDELLLISDALERREAGSIQRVLDMTQPPLAPPAQQDAFLAQLREEVSQLQQALAGGVVHTEHGLQPRIQLYGDAGSLNATPKRPVPGTTGATMPGATLTPDAQEAPSLSQGESAAGAITPEPAGQAPENQGTDTTAGAPAPPATSEAPGSSATPAIRTSSRPSLEPEGYTADSLRQGRLLFRANRFDAAIKVLSAIPDDPEADYWCARAYEALGNEHEAEVRYRRLVGETGAGEYIARRAQHDLSFLEWKQRFKDQNEQ